MRLQNNIIEENPVNEEDYNDFLNRRHRANNKSIRTKVTTLKDNGEVVSEIMGTTVGEYNKSEVDKVVEPKLSADGNNDEVTSNFGTNSTDESTSKNVNVVKPQIKKEVVESEVEVKKENEPNNKVIEDKNSFGIKPMAITILVLVGLVATVKILKNNKLKKIILN